MNRGLTQVMVPDDPEAARDMGRFFPAVAGFQHPPKRYIRAGACSDQAGFDQPWRTC